MDAAALGDVDDLGFDLGFMDDGFECFDFDFDLLDKDLAEFCGGDGGGGGGGCLLPAVVDKEDWLGLDLGFGDGGEGGRESSPDSVVTDDGAPPLSSESSGDHDDGEMSAYVSELERFLMEDEDDVEAGEPLAAKELARDDHFFGDLDDGYVEPSIPAEEFAAADAYVEPATPGKDLVDDYFFGDLVVGDDGYIEPSVEDLVADDYFLYDLAVDDGCVEPGDAASATEEEDAVAREDDDEATSRKRARQRKDTAAVPREAELRATPRRHDISLISAGRGCRRLGHHRLPPRGTMCVSA